MANYVDVTPSWVSMVAVFRMVIENTEQPIHREAMWSEIERMAKLADLYVASQKPAKAADEIFGDDE